MALPPINGRPPSLPATTAPSAGDARSAAQRAFFQAALTKAGATAPASAPTRAAAPQATSASRAVQPAVTRVTNETTAQPQPTRILRPGSIVDIKV